MIHGCKRLLGLASVLFAMSAAAQSVNLVQNGDFSSNTISGEYGGSAYVYYSTSTNSYPFSTTVPATGWTFSNDQAGIARNGSAWGFDAVPSESFVAFLQGNGASLSQEIGGLTVGDLYTLTFSSEQRPGYLLLPLTVSIGGSTLVSSLDPGSVWTTYTESFKATSSTEDLLFAGSGGGLGDIDTGIAGVSVTNVPEIGQGLWYLGISLSLCLGIAVFSKKRSDLDGGQESAL